ncbi:MAG: hypothetical protein L6R40_005132 [Gallowayella cf. fulva]|nr:MAG: hypothetical protein L6R40_005132 [Xanthomendoza cf. fulva]
MPDIRSFFGGHGMGPSQEKLTPKETPKSSKAKSRGKRKVLSDSEDDAKAPTAKQSTPRRPAPNKKM